VARKAVPKQTTPVDAIQHNDKRTNIPTADAQVFVKPEIEEIRKVRLERDESLDPQLVWRGKYDEHGAGEDLIADAPPIYIQEKIVPRVLIENLRRTAERPEDEPEFTLFDSFDGLDELDELDFYKHQANWSNRMILGDGLQVMASLAEREKLRGRVQMIYIDPPYGIKFGSNWQVSARNRDVKDGKLEDAAREVEQIKAFRDTWELGIHSYLSYLRDRLLVARDLLTESGSCFVQIGDENVHLVRSLMDEVFGAENCVAQIAFTKSGGGLDSTNRIPTRLDYIVWYGRSLGQLKYRTLYEDRSDLVSAGFTNLLLQDGSIRSTTKEERTGSASMPAGSRLFRTESLTKPGPGSRYVVEWEGHSYTSGTRWWGNPKEATLRLLRVGRVRRVGNSLRYIRFFDDFGRNRLSNLWDGIGGAPSPIYVVQTNTKVIERCMLMSTDPGDLILDPTCGSGTTSYVAEQWGRRWITIDTSRVALALARQRIMGSLFPWYLLADSAEGHAKEKSLSAQPLPRQDFSDDIRHGFVYQRIPRITLNSIANNPDIREGMSAEDIDAAVRRHADSEFLYDKPYEDPKKVRVAGPFTVESLNPHRSLAFAVDDSHLSQEPLSETEGTKHPDSPTFEHSILDNLSKAGIQNGRRNERIKFASALEPYAGEYIQAIGERAVAHADEGSEASERDPVRIAVAVGPQYGTVSASFVKNAAREALGADGVELLCVLGFAFDPQVSGSVKEDGVTVDVSDEGFASVESSRNLGRLPVLMVRMNADLLMGEELKKTGTGNLFTVFGEPDIDVDETDKGYVVSIKGIDVYDPTTGEVRSNDTSQIALWMVDTNYSGDSFFVRHCYFTGGGDPYKRLKVALKADIDADAWASLNSDVSLPFSKPETGKIAVKVINDYGDEVMKVFKI
jgi:adenine-specific DNA-methyltransferase